MNCGVHWPPPALSKPELAIYRQVGRLFPSHLDIVGVGDGRVLRERRADREDEAEHDEHERVDPAQQVRQRRPEETQHNRHSCSDVTQTRRLRATPQSFWSAFQIPPPTT